MVYDGGANHVTLSRNVSVVITKAKAAASATATRVGYGTTDKIKGTVRGAGSAPDGVVKIYRGSTALAAGRLANGVVTISLPRLNPGTYPLTVKYLGGTKHLAVNTSVTQYIAKSTPAVTAKFIGSLTVAGTHKITVTVKKSSPAPGGTVRVYRGSKLLGSAKLNSSGAAAITLPKLGAGGHAFKVTYSGDVRYTSGSATTSVQLTKARTFGDGMYRVGVDIPAGLYRVKVPAGELCYWARLKDTSGSVYSILANQLETDFGLVRVLPTDRFVESSSCGTWRLVAETSNWPFRNKSFPGDGVFIVNKDISPGTYTQYWSDCYVELLSDATGDFDDIIDNEYSDGPLYLTLSSNVFAVRTSDCSTWYRG